METLNRLRRAYQLFSETMKGYEFVPRSPVADEIVPGILHPEGPGGVTRTEVYYGETSFGTGAKIPPE